MFFTPIQNEQIERGVCLLRQSVPVAIPTETVYGLAARISDDIALKKVFSIKKRPFFDPLIVHVGSTLQAKTLVDVWPSSADQLAQRFWPGPLTLVLPKSPRVSDIITSGLETVAIRCPKHPIAQSLIERVGEPLAAPSANLFGKTSPTEAQHIRTEFDDTVFVIDGGQCDVGIESTILKIDEVDNEIHLTLLRSGQIVPSQIQEALAPLNKKLYLHLPGKNIEAPGQIKHHYMPSIPMLWIERKLWDSLQSPLEYLNQRLTQNFQSYRELSLSPSPEWAARELYIQMRQTALSSPDFMVFIHEPYQTGDLWAGILDRLRRAASYNLSKSDSE